MQNSLKFIAKKKPNIENVMNYLTMCEIDNQWSNFGPVTELLEARLTKFFNLSKDLTVVMTSSGTAALHALVQMHSYFKEKKLNWLISSFSFPCLKQGPLKNAKVVDCDKNCMLQLDEINFDFDGMIVTNIYGSKFSLNKYKEFCKNKILLIDSATAFDNVEHGENEFISFHHTKPWGFGEGGCAIISKKNERIFRSILNFGIQSNTPESIIKWASNFKMSEQAAAFILDRIDQNDLFKYKLEYQRIVNLVPNIKFINSISTVGYVTFIFDDSIELICNDHFEIKKYYKPIIKTKIASDIFSKILCVPCHPDMSEINDSSIVESIQKHLNLFQK